MSPAPKADVIVPLDDDRELARRCLEAVLERSGPILGRLIVVDTLGPDAGMTEDLERLVARDGRIRILSGVPGLGPVDSYNRGLCRREGDAVLLSSDCIVTGDWLVELAAVARSEERTACASPLTNVGGPCSVPERRVRHEGASGGRQPPVFSGSRQGADAPRPPGVGLPGRARNRYRAVESLDDEEVRDACAGLPCWTVAPTLSSSCIYLRGDVIDAVGQLDPSLAGITEAVDDWIARALALGFMAKRANRVFVPVARHAPLRVPSDPGRVTVVTPSDPAPAATGEDRVRHRLERFCQSLDGHLAAHAVELRTTGRIRVAFDIRHLPKELVGTRRLAICLAQALARRADIDLTLLVHEPAQAEGMSGRVINEEQWCNDVAVIHRPAQVFDPRDLGLLFRSSAHLVITYQDLIGYRIPQVYRTEAESDGYRAISGLSLPAFQKVLASSGNAAAEIAAEFGIPREEIAIVPLGVEAAEFARHEETDGAIRESLGLPRRYFLSLATDYPHKNLLNLLDAYELLRRRWRGGEPPGLVLAGHANSTRTGLYSRARCGSMGEGLTILGPVTHEQLRVLYQGALALVFPSLYEGFGLPPLEAMAAGTPVIAMPISSVPEVAGDAAYYPAGLSCRHLAQAMLTVADDEELRAELRERGLRRADRFRWDETARATRDAYRSAILEPSARSLRLRRHLEDTLRCWGDARILAASPPRESQAPSPGIRDAWRALNFALHRRLRRELDRFHPAARREPA